MIIADIVAIVSAIIAFISAIVAVRAVYASKTANRIALLQHRLKVVDGLRRFGSVLTTKGPQFPEEELWLFQETVLLAEVLFAKDIHEECNAILETAFEVKSLLGLQDTEENVGAGLNGANQKKMQTLHRQARDRCRAVELKLKRQMRVGNA